MKCKLSVLFGTFIALGTQAHCQEKNAYLFIEPNISVSYDSSFFKPGQRFSNSVYETEAYDFKLLDSSRTTIYIEAKDGSASAPSREAQKKFLQNRLHLADQLVNDSIGILARDSTVREVGDFFSQGLTMYYKMQKDKFSSMIISDHVSKDDATQINYISYTGKDLGHEYSILTRFISGIKFYTHEQIAAQEEIIKKKYTVEVLPAKDSLDQFGPLKTTYIALVKVPQKLENKVKEVRLNIDYGEEIFAADEKGEALIRCYDKDKGLIERKGVLVVINSFGKNVKLPFSFSYFNN